MRAGWLVIALLPAVPLGAQEYTGFSAASAARQATLEAVLGATPDTAMAARHARTLAARPHVAGTPAQRATADYVLQQMASWGLDTLRREYEVYLPFHDSTIVEVIGATRDRLVLSEPPIAGDPTTSEPAFPAMNGYSGAGDVTAPVVYVNYGLAADYAMLDSLGISVQGKIVLARYGRAYRGIKPREAERRGAIGVILYSDPMDDGFLAGDVYPAGPMRNPDGVQRGSIFNGQGDPSTPGWASIAGARRLPEAERGLPRIPVVPIGYGNARRFLEQLGGPSVPNGWQGGLGFRYHIGDDRLRARVAVWPERGARAYKRIANTFGMIRGRSAPDDWVVVGAHRDAWSPGAVDNVSGVVSVLEAARAWSVAVARGMRPERTLVFATWDAEEWGLVGAVEFAEQMADSLSRQVVAYINQDVSASGPSFGAAGTASLHAVVHDVTRAVKQPGDSVSVYRDWERRTVTSQRPLPTIGDLGGGSDFLAFYNHLGIPSVGYGFGGPGGSYHSGYDTYTFMERFADPGYRSHRAAAAITALLMGRLANAEVVPYDHRALGQHLGTLVARIRTEPGADGIAAELDDLASATTLFARLGERFALRRNGALSAGHAAAAFATANATLRQVEPMLTDAAGLIDRPFMRNLVFATDRNDGYANVPLPGVVEALRDGDLTRAARAAKGIATRLRDAAALVERATRELPAVTRP